jgi:uncharacterized protein YecE (DUF72 family)
VSPHPLYLGTCTWNYDSWAGLVYDRQASTAAEYLRQYAQRYNAVEIDSWFYHMPNGREVTAYKDAVGPEFRFTCKVPQEICLTHLRGKPGEALAPNPHFLSLDLLSTFLDTVSPLFGQIAAVMFEFEYLNKQKCPSLNAFIEKLGSFFAKAPRGMPYALEPRNANYLKPQYFQFVQQQGLIHVLSEKQYLPHIYDVYDQFTAYFGDTVVIRLLGGDRKAIEAKTGNSWDRLVEPKDDLAAVARMIAQMRETRVVITMANNHYEGSAPLTLKRLLELLSV